MFLNGPSTSKMCVGCQEVQKERCHFVSFDGNTDSVILLLELLLQRGFILYFVFDFR